MKKLITMIMLAGLILMTAVISSAHAEDVSNGLLAGVEAASPMNWNSETRVWKTGKIDFIDSEGVVIEDTKYRLSSSINFFNIDGIILKVSSFDPGTEVTFVLESDRKLIVTLIKGTIEE